MKLPTSSAFRIMGIDQSLTGTGVVVTDANGAGVNDELKLVAAHLVITKGVVGWERLDRILKSVTDLVGQYDPTVIVMEDYTRMASSAALAPLIELASCIKLDLHRMGRDVYVQNQSSMKKFIFGDGSTVKDSSYLLKVHDITTKRFSMPMRFADDNTCDAFLHTWLFAELIWTLQGSRNPELLPAKQRETIWAKALKVSKLTNSKFNALLPGIKLFWLKQAFDVVD